MMRIPIVVFILLLFLPIFYLDAQEVGLPGTEQDIEARLKHLSLELRCLVCQNQTLADSHAPLAEDLRKEIRLLIAQGKSDEEVLEFLVARYGDFVRYRPPLKGTTWLLWFGPFLLLGLGMAMLSRTLRRRRSQVTSAPLTQFEHEHVRQLLAEKRNS
jgi:cytochrome c-type biogenesis protein CcmH